MHNKNDNVRSEIIRRSGVNPVKCMLCGKCTATCPAFDTMEYHPHQFVSMVESGDIEFKNVHFKYEGAERESLKGINFRIADGERIALVGRNGSGKTTLARHIANAFGDRVAVITHDSYYRAQNDKTLEERALQNYDHPDAFETDLLCEHLDALARGEAVNVPIYDYTVHNRSSRTERVEPRAVVILEGILIFCDERLREKMDLKIFVDLKSDERLVRRMQLGMVDEVRGLMANGASTEFLLKLGLEYRYLTRYLQGEIGYDQMVLELGNAIKKFAKRQMTWFRRDKSIIWLDMRNDPKAQAIAEIEKFMNA